MRVTCAAIVAAEAAKGLRAGKSAQGPDDLGGYLSTSSRDPRLYTVVRPIAGSLEARLSSHSLTPEYLPMNYCPLCVFAVAIVAFLLALQAAFWTGISARKLPLSL